MQPYIQQQQWILSLGFKNNISANFKAWIMYNNQNIYNPQGLHKIKPQELINFKKQYDYDTLKSSKNAPWYNFLINLQNISHNPDIHNHDIDNQDIDNQDIDNQDIDNTDIDWQKKYNDLKQMYIKEKKLRKYFNSVIKLLRSNISTTTIKCNDLQDQINKLKKNAVAANNKYLVLKTHNDILKKDILNADTYITQCYNRIRELDKYITLLKQENTSFKNDLGDISSSSLSNTSIQELNTKYQNKTVEGIPSIICPITQEIMIEPVIAFDGHTYEKNAIQQWFQSNNKSPISGQKLPNRVLIANHTIRKTIAEIISLNTS